MLSKTVKIRKYKTTIWNVVLYGCKAWSVILREKNRLRVCEGKVLRRILGPKRDDVTRGENCITCIPVHSRLDSQGLFWWEIQKERGQYEGQDVGGRIILKLMLKKQVGSYGLD
jgi:hypothetical protein